MPVLSTHNIVVLESLGMVMSGVTEANAGEMTTACTQSACIYIYGMPDMVSNRSYIQNQNMRVTSCSAQSRGMYYACSTYQSRNFTAQYDLSAIAAVTCATHFVSRIEPTGVHPVYQELTREREGSDCKNMSPKLENEAFSAKSTQCLNAIRNVPYNSTETY